MRQLLNQLRLAYFVPCKPSRNSTASSYSLTKACFTQSSSSQGCCGYHTPSVPLVTYLPSVVVSTLSRTQTPSVIPQSNPFSQSFDNFCVPDRRVLNPLSGTTFGSLFLLDYSSFYRRGYTNAFQQLGHKHPTYPLLLKNQPINLFF